MSDNSPGLGKKLENSFERVLWSLRFIVLLGVIFGAISAIILFVVGSFEIFSVLNEAFFEVESHLSHETILIGLIGAIDFYLIGLVLLIFSFGIYELFISQIDIARSCGSFTNILEVRNLDDLKNKILKVIIMVLIVTFFQRVLDLDMASSIDALAMAISICLICIGVYYMGRHNI
ncbi:conserved hypothetical protein [Methanolacinia petrolearia DSM 11571]|uniref:YqhA family protein n=1 Tax=Methanolacinia petrolearia (strain DSM 11571 / OCM 486 / SEBR 4847) TaxID=679926 RepID=E1RFA0_METP4|nr:YqhA family protein [Methanolacinia petrolearia]ADN35048.1 conserved hypothetical protein [Methanolacinia petrolearia DSM 11571]